MRIRAFESSDIDDVIDVFRRSVRKLASADYSEAQCLAWAPDVIDPLAWRAKRPGDLAWVALDNSDMAGFVDLKPDGYIDMLYVHPDFKRRGAATALMQAAEKEARRLGVKQMSTEASLTAHPFFEAAGFSVVRRQTVEFNGQKFDNFYMRKAL